MYILGKHCSWFILRVNDLQCMKYNGIAVASGRGIWNYRHSFNLGQRTEMPVQASAWSTPWDTSDVLHFQVQSVAYCRGTAKKAQKNRHIISDSAWIVTGPHAVLLQLINIWWGLSSVAHSPWCAMSLCNEPNHHCFAGSLKESSWKVPWKGWRWDLPCSWHSSPLLLMKRGWKNTLLLNLTWAEGEVSLSSWH